MGDCFFDSSGQSKKRSAFGILLLLCEVDSLTAPVKLRCTLQQVRGRTLGHVWLVDFSKKKGNQALVDSVKHKRRTTEY